jgi:hypothetical protein
MAGEFGSKVVGVKLFGGGVSPRHHNQWKPRGGDLTAGRVKPTPQIDTFCIEDDIVSFE